MSATGRGRLIWHHHVSDRAEDCASFYAALFGWSFEEAAFGGGGAFFVFSLGELGLGNLSSKEAGDALPNRWMAYANVTDLEAVLERAAAQGGDVLLRRRLPELGARFALLRDPQGGLICPWQGDGDDAPEHDAAPAAGTVAWSELASPDPTTSIAFYRELFGWEPDSTDAARTLMRRGADRCEAAIVPADPGAAEASWIPHFAVVEPEDAATRAQSLGARILRRQPTLLLTDPAGVRFGLHAPTAPSP